MTKVAKDKGRWVAKDALEVAVQGREGPTALVLRESWFNLENEEISCSVDIPYSGHLHLEIKFPDGEKIQRQLDVRGAIEGMIEQLLEERG